MKTGFEIFNVLLRFGKISPTEQKHGKGIFKDAWRNLYPAGDYNRLIL